MEEKKKKAFSTYILIACIVIAGLYIVIIFFGTGILSPLPYLHLDSFYGKVVDADTKEPIEGAAVLAVYHKEVPGVAGSNTYSIDAQEALTDEKGEFKIPQTKRWFVLNRGYTEGNLIIFKPAYGVFPRHELSNAIGESKTWPPPEKYIVYEMPKLKTMEERDNNIHFSRPNIPNILMIEFIKLLNQERVYLGYDPFTIEVKEK